ncbi:putative fibrocystin-L-like [Brachionus plicatilis]|uniref:Putative fibrocystin-L-like n=1 Tax=Brachionus plicatilis TaxID=10195 RepID=A0A3M7P989_BRAPC|nr:putative fibrocystin-L-like [Brachionus plicatilis]
MSVIVEIPNNISQDQAFEPNPKEKLEETIISSINNNNLFLLPRTDQQFEYVFYVSSFEPRLSSKRGGSLITIYGDGFNDDDCLSNKVTFERYNCKVINCSENWIICETESAHTVYEITNNGNNPRIK